MFDFGKSGQLGMAATQFCKEVLSVRSPKIRAQCSATVQGFRAWPDIFDIVFFIFQGKNMPQTKTMICGAGHGVEGHGSGDEIAFLHDCILGI